MAGLSVAAEITAVKKTAERLESGLDEKSASDVVWLTERLCRI